MAVHYLVEADDKQVARVDPCEKSRLVPTTFEQELQLALVLLGSSPEPMRACHLPEDQNVELALA